MQNRPLVYWLEYVRSLAGAEAPVIVVQSQCDRVSDEQEAPMPGQHGFARLQRTACSAKQRDGMERFVPALKAAAACCKNAMVPSGCRKAGWTSPTSCARNAMPGKKPSAGRAMWRYARRPIRRPFQGVD